MWFPIFKNYPVFGSWEYDTSKNSTVGFSSFHVIRRTQNRSPIILVSKWKIEFLSKRIRCEKVCSTNVVAFISFFLSFIAISFLHISFSFCEKELDVTSRSIARLVYYFENKFFAEQTVSLWKNVYQAYNAKSALNQLNSIQLGAIFTCIDVVICVCVCLFFFLCTIASSNHLKWFYKSSKFHFKDFSFLSECDSISFVPIFCFVLCCCLNVCMKCFLMIEIILWKSVFFPLSRIYSLMKIKRLSALTSRKYSK